MYGDWQYVLHCGYKLSQHALMTSAPELHINKFFGAINDSRTRMRIQIWQQESRYTKRYACLILVSSLPSLV